MPFGPSFVAPSLNADGTLNWGGQERAILQALLTAAASMIGASAIDLSDGDLSLAANALINVGAVSFTISGDDGLNRTLYMDANGDAWFRDGSGRNIQMTASGQMLGPSGSAAFFGDYVGSTAKASYNAAALAFSFTSSTGSYATLEAGELRAHNGSSVGYVGIKAPSGMSTAMDLTFPSTLPPTKQIVTVDATGSVDFAAGASLDSRGMIVSGNLAVSGTIYQTQQVTWIDTSTGQPVNPGVNGPTWTGDNLWNQGSGLAQIDFPLPFPAGTRLIEIDLWIYKNGATPQTASLLARSPLGSVVGHTSILARRSAGTGSAVPLNLTLANGVGILTGSMPQIMSTSGSYSLRWESAAGGGDVPLALRIVWDRPLGS